MEKRTVSQSVLPSEYRGASRVYIEQVNTNSGIAFFTFRKRSDVGSSYTVVVFKVKPKP